MAMTCSIPGIFNDIHSRSVDVANRAYQYGLFIGVGSPSQNNSIWPSITRNETYFRTSGFCAAGSLPQCVTSSSGEINPTISSTWRDNPSYRLLDNPNLPGNVSTRYGKDTLTIWTHYTDPSPPSGTFLYDFPVTLISNYTAKSDPFFDSGSLGLGSASTVLDNLYEQNLISTRSFGLYLGTAFSRAGGSYNGSLIFGGYDSARFTGPVHTYSQVPATSTNSFSPFQLRISQITLDIPSQVPVDLLDRGTADAYLTTAQYPVQFTRSITQKLAGKLSAKPNDVDNTLQFLGASNANLTITLDDGLKVTFDSKWLSNTSSISPISSLPLSSPLATSNSSGLNASLPQVDNSPIVLGAAFLEQLYLFVSYDSKPPTFSLAQAVAGTKYVEQKPLCPGIAPQVATSRQISTFVQQGMIGAVIGGTIGGVALISLIIFILKFKLPLWLTRRESNLAKKQAKPNPPRLDKSSNGLHKVMVALRKSVKFASRTPHAKGSWQTSTPEANSAIRANSLSSNSSSSTKVSISVVHVATTDQKPLEMTTYPKQNDLPTLDFGFNTTNTPQHPSYHENPYLSIPAVRHNNRSSSVYSTD